MARPAQHRRDPSKHLDEERRRSTTTGLYVHIPFCRRRCRYCDFAVVPIGPRASTETAAASAAASRTRESHDGDDDDDGQASSHDTDAVTSGFERMNDAYTDALLRELRTIRPPSTTKPDDGVDDGNEGEMGNNNKILLHSVYFGGGTPSLAPVGTIRRILDAILGRNDDFESPFRVLKDAEISIEMDPGTFTRDKLVAIKDMGFNRISFGIQSFDDDILQSLGRVHTSQDIWNSLAMLQDVYGESEGSGSDEGHVNRDCNDSMLNYSIDLISGLPGLTPAKWTETLCTAVNLRPRPSHLSLYDLIIENGTVFGRLYGSDDNNDGREEQGKSSSSSFHRTRGEVPGTSRSGVRPLPSEEDSAFMYKYAAGYLRSRGYEHYEVSSYALLPTKQVDEAAKDDDEEQDKRIHGGPPASSPRRSRHNQIYWALDSHWYAVGLGATSFVDQKLVARPRTLADYTKWVDDLENQNGILSWDDRNNPPETMNEFDLLTDVVLKRLRTSEGLCLDWVWNRYGGKEGTGEAYVSAILKGAELGLQLGLVVHDVADTVPVPTRRQESDGALGGGEQDGPSSDGEINWGTLRLTDPDGFLYSNTIISSIFVELEAVEDERSQD